MKKRFLAFLLAVVMVVGMVPAAALAAASYSDEELCSMAKQHYTANHGSTPPLVEVDSTEGTTVVIHLYEVAMGHTATWGWYYIDRNTGKGYDFLTNDPIDLTPYAAGNILSKGSIEYEELQDFLTQFQLWGDQTYDYRSVKTQEKNILQAMLFSAPCYVGPTPNMDHSESDVSGKDPLGRWEPYEYSKRDAAQVDWVLANVFNCTQTDIINLRSSLRHDVYGQYYFDGYYYFYAGGIGGVITEAVITDITPDGNRYHVAYELRVSDICGIPSMVGSVTGRYFAVVERKQISGSGKEYWSLYYHSTEPDNFEEIAKITINGKSVQSLFSKSSMEYDNDLALFAANLSSAAEDTTGEGIDNFFNSLGWPAADRRNYQYDGDFAFSIACAKLSKDENLLVITARGSQTFNEYFKDAMSFGTRDFFGYTTNDVIYDFERDIMAALNGELKTETEGFLDGHEYLMEQPLKILITGHSLGGAAANLNAARFTRFVNGGAWWSDLTKQSDIYCYTFGAINSLSDNVTRKNGFENIHNVYNLYDSFSPYCWGKWLPSGLGRGYGKFGHMDTYTYDYAKEVKNPPVYYNHLMVNYIDSLAKRYVSCKTNARSSVYRGAVLCPVDLKIYLETTDGPVLVGSITGNKIDEIEHPMGTRPTT